MMENATNSTLVAGLSSAWRWSATLTNVEDGVHRLTVPPVKTPRGKWTKSKDHFLIRVGQPNNPVVFTRTANYSSTLLVQAANDKLMLNHSAAGADLFRYSTNFGTSFSEWTPYNGGMTEIEKQAWTGTNSQAWTGEHVRVEYFSRFRGSADHVQQGDLGTKQRRLPHLFLNGPYNSYGYDGGLDNSLKLHNDNEWSLDWMTEWSTSGAVAQLNVWGINPDGQPDQTQVFGDIDGDSVLDRLPPSSLAKLVLNITDAPPKPHLAWKILVNDGNMRFQLIPVGNMNYQLALYVILWILPLITAAASAWIFVLGFYKIKLNSLGATKKVVSILPVAVRRPLSKLFHARHRLYETKFDSNGASEKVPSILPVAIRRPLSKLFLSRPTSEQFLQVHPKPATEPAITSQRTVLIATMEYNIDDWNIKIKIGGLGVMSQLMGTNIPNLIWVVPCVGGIDYPIDEPAAPMNVTILGTTYTVNVQYHTVKNITYVLLDAPVFRKQTKAEPYPARMDDMESAIYYSAWNQCIAQSIQRFPEVDIYHINDYHGTIAPLYLLPRTIPVCLSLHNAEFQGLWPMRRVAEKEEICMVFNLPVATVTRYVQFGQVSRLSHSCRPASKVFVYAWTLDVPFWHLC
jgi:alpha-1,3-glucan synthase